MADIDNAEQRTIDGAELRAALDVAERWLEANREALNAINVYPVPDGDTGTNMLLTLRAALAAAPVSGTVSVITRAMADAALLGARGNSGVILSQMLRGFANGLDGCERLGGAELSRALATASETAYAAVSAPVEGTMLTVLREAAERAASPGNFDQILSTAVTEAEASVERTPQLLPRLRDAGVVDAGGQGIAVLLAGLRYGIRGEELPEAPTTSSGAVDLDALAHEGHGYCVEFVIEGAGLDRAAILTALGAVGGESLLVVGDPSTLHVHVHADDPGPALSIGASHGGLQAVKVDNMQAQHERWAAAHEAPGPDPEGALPAIGLVAVAQGEGIKAAFRDLGATAIVDGGATNNPSAGDLLEAARRAGSERVFLLPNDPNVLMAAKQAAQHEPELIRVIPARSVASGLAAAVCFAPSGNPDAIEDQLRTAAEAARCIEVTRAVRDSAVDGLRVAAGDAIALLDGKLVARTQSLDDALLEAIALAVDDETELVSVYLGVDAKEESAAAAVARIEAAHPRLHIEVVSGGQPHYPYVVGLE